MSDLTFWSGSGSSVFGLAFLVGTGLAFLISVGRRFGLVVLGWLASVVGSPIVESISIAVARSVNPF